MDQNNQTPQNPNIPQTQTIVASNPKSGGKKVIVGVVVLLVTVLGVVAGVLLNQQSQDIRSRASGSCAGIDNPSIYGTPITIPDGCTVNVTRFKGPAPSGTTDCVGYSENGSNFTATGPTSITVNPSCGQCEQVDFQANGQSYGTAKYGGECEPYKTGKVCGETCSSDSDCISESSSGVAVSCRNGTCQNTSCAEGRTEPGTICQCLEQGVCGSPCGPSGTLCTGEAGITCGFLNPPNQCAERGGIQYCIPTSPNNGYSINRCTNDNGLFHLEGPNGETGSQLTVDDVIEACAPQATEPPVVTEPPAASVSAQCLNIQAFDTDWNLLTVNDLAQLSPGDTVRFTVAGSATGGAFDMARFTINGALRTPVNELRAGTEEFYDEYTVPEGATGLTVSAEIHHSSLDWF